jgi:hypothetical protein
MCADPMGVQMARDADGRTADARISIREQPIRIEPGGQVFGKSGAGWDLCRVAWGRRVSVITPRTRHGASPGHSSRAGGGASG